MLSVLDALQQKGCNFGIVAIAQPVGRLADALAERGIPLRSWSICDDSGLRRSQAEIEASLNDVIASIQPDLVHANSLAMGRLLGRLAGQLGIPTSGHLRDIIKLSAAAVADLNQNQRLVAVSAATCAYHVSQGVEERRLCVIHNGVDLNRFQPRSPTGWLHGELGIDRSARLMACIGQIGLRKGQDVLAAAAPDIVAQVPDAHFLLIGERTSQKTESIEFEQAIHRRFAEAGLSDRLHALGHREDVADILSEIDLLVHPANQEPFGRVLLEASAAGVSIVATDVGGTSEIVVDGLTGLLVPPRNSSALAKAVTEIVSDQTKSFQFRENARRRAVSEFSNVVAADRLSRVWHDLIVGRK